eukprot:TRINITY_DN5893_c0_g1_i1.p1 TRINITY_DN5893_c0_g1~~TRINITY_DN5893_c0_g1_i1.p1  ORF type:complete len:583 (+),score=138.00 TRINITY_DN5893_c0_g1_i1:207-1751(+)
MQPHARPYKFETFPRMKVIAVFGIFFGLLLISLIIGAAGPEVWKEHKHTFEANTLELDNFVDGASPLFFDYGPLTSLNQLTILTLQFDHKNDELRSVGKDFEIKVDLYGSDSDQDGSHDVSQYSRVGNAGAWHDRHMDCEEGNSACSDVILEHETYIGNKYFLASFYVKDLMSIDSDLGSAEVKVRYINKEFTSFELAFRLSFIILTGMFLVYYASKLHKYKAFVTTEQKWILALVIGCILMNNPFFALSFLVDGWFFPFLDTLFITLFLTMILLFWLIMSHMILVPKPDDRKWYKFYLPKFVLLGLLWVLFITVILWTRLHSMDDSGTTAEDMDGFYTIFFLLALLCLVYLFYLFYIVFRIIGQRKVIARVGPRVAVLWGLSMAVVAVIIASIVLRFYGPTSNSAAVFLVMFSLFNLYACILGYFFLPTKKPLHPDAGVELQPPVADRSLHDDETAMGDDAEMGGLLHHSKDNSVEDLGGDAKGDYDDADADDTGHAVRFEDVPIGMDDHKEE